MKQRLYQLIPILGIILLNSCSSNNTEGQFLSYNLEDSFPWDERTSLVIYAAKSLDDNPDKSFPSLIYHDFDNSGFISDEAPYLTALDAEDMLEEINNWIEKPSNTEDQVQALFTENWVETKISEGWTHFLYETEPPEYAGNAYPWASYADKNKTKSAILPE